jgi:acyl-coenzyme A synthetase/AMP-(fatty) acid ligase
MNNSVVFAGFAPTSRATRIVDAQAKLVVAVDAGMRAANFVQAVVEGDSKRCRRPNADTRAVVRRSELSIPN